MAACNCNALPVPHVHEKDGIKPVEAGKKDTPASDKPKGFTPAK